MSVNPTANRGFLTRGTRALAVTLVFLFIGPLIEIALFGILFFCYVVFSKPTDEASGAIYILILMIGVVLVLGVAKAGLVGLIVGVHAMLVGQLNVWIMLTISVGTEIASSLLAVRAFDAIESFSFVASMMVCWKITNMLTGKTPVIENRGLA